MEDYPMTLLRFAIPILAAILLFTNLPKAHADAASPDIYQFVVTNIDGKSVPLSKYKGKVLLIVNTASLCGNTPQYASLEKLYSQYKHQGLLILAFPANNIGHQEPGPNGQIKEFCTGTYHVTFDLFSKISVLGDDQAPLYHYLTDKSTDPQFAGDIEWNFAKFLIGRDGKILQRFPAHHDPLLPDVVGAVQSALGQPKTAQAQ
jgi:glutathione peroxidase